MTELSSAASSVWNMSPCCHPAPSVWDCYDAAPFSSNQFKIKNEIFAAPWPHSVDATKLSYILLIQWYAIRACLLKDNNVTLYTILLSVSIHPLVHSSVVSLYCWFDSVFAFLSLFISHFPLPLFMSPNYAAGSIHANGKSITWHSCTVITEHLSWHRHSPFHEITKFSSHLKSGGKSAPVVRALTNVCRDERSWTCSSGKKNAKSGPHGGIYTSWGSGQDKMGFAQHQFNPAKSCCLTAFQFFMGKGHRKRSI